MAFGEELKNKADEVHLQEKAKDFGDALAEVVKTAVSLAAGYAQQNRGKVDNALDKAEASIEQRTGGKHTETVTKVRATVDKGIDKLVEKTPGGPAAPGTTGAAGATGPTGAAGASGAAGAAAGTTSAAPIPDDTFSAFDDDTPSGSPS